MAFVDEQQNQDQQLEMTSIVENLGPLPPVEEGDEGRIEYVLSVLSPNSKPVGERAVLRFCLPLVVSDGPLGYFKSTIASFQRWIQSIKSARCF